MTNIAKPQNWKNSEDSIFFFNFKKTIIRILGNVIMKVHAKFQEMEIPKVLAQMEISKNRGELNNVNIAKSKNWKMENIQEIFRNSKKEKLGF